MHYSYFHLGKHFSTKLSSMLLSLINVFMIQGVINFTHFIWSHFKTLHIKALVLYKRR